MDVTNPAGTKEFNLGKDDMTDFAINIIVSNMEPKRDFCQL